jgi:hypothetical protein
MTETKVLRSWLIAMTPRMTTSLAGLIKHSYAMVKCRWAATLRWPETVLRAFLAARRQQQGSPLLTIQTPVITARQLDS